MFILRWSLQIVVIALRDLETGRRKLRHSSEKMHIMKYGLYLYSISNYQLYCQGTTSLL